MGNLEREMRNNSQRIMPLEEANKDIFTELIQRIIIATGNNLSTLLKQKVTLSLKEIMATSLITDRVELSEKNEALILLQSAGAIATPLAVQVSSESAWSIADLMMGGTGQNNDNEDFDDVKQPAFKKAVQQSLLYTIGKIQEVKPDLELSFPEVKLRLLNADDADSIKAPNGFDDPISVKLEAKIGNLLTVEVFVHLTTATASFIVENLADLNIPAEEDDTNNPEVSKANFAEQSKQNIPAVDEEKNLSLLMDIKMGLVVELGRSEMSLRDILKLNRGTVIELDRLSGEPVDLFVNNKLIARGEVVVIDDSFGLRITQLAGNLNLAEEMGLLSSASA